MQSLEQTDGPTDAIVRKAYSIQETAEILGVSPNSIRRLVDRRQIRASRALRHLLIPATEIDRFLKATLS